MENNNIFNFYNNLGFNNPYYFLQDEHFIIEGKFKDILNKYNAKTHIDPVALVEALNKNFALADRTIIKNIYKTPWLAKPSINNNSWEFDEIPKHGKTIESQLEISEKFFKIICEEILEYTQNKKTIGLLLSGGMDSRMVAGAIDFLIKTDKLDVEVTGLTWGNKDSRDVVYAQEIAKRLGWKWKHYTVDAKELLRNISETGLHGCEYSPIHLHAIPQIRDDNDLDVILAGSYGDSIGRAEYGGVNVKNLVALNENIQNIGNLVNKEIFQNSLAKIDNDIEHYHNLFPAEEMYMQREYDYQLHYMRRQLNPCMELFTEKMSFFQIFTHPKTFRFIFSIHPSLRNDNIYKFMLSKFKTNLEDIPWARTGLRYGENKGTPDDYSKRHHSYVEILNYEILDNIRDLALSEEIRNLNIFNFTAIEELFRLVKKYPLNSFYYTEKLTWLASLAILINNYKVSADINSFSEDTSAIKKIVSNEYMPKYYKNKLGGYLRYLKIIK